MTLPANNPSDPKHPAAGGVGLEVVRKGVQLIALHDLRDAEAAEDIAQETMRRLLEALEKRSGEIADVPAFARGIARHLIADARRDAVRRQSLETVEPERLATVSDPLDGLIKRENMDRLRGALATLPADDRALLRALYVDGLSSADLAALLAQPQERIRKRKSRALARLREAFLGHSLPPRTTEERDQ